MVVSGPVESAWEHDVELVECGLPVVGGASSLGSGVGAAEVSAAEVEQLDQSIVVGEVAAGLADLAELVVDALDHVGGVDDLADLGCEREERDDLLPGRLPVPADRGVLASDLAVGPGIQGFPGGLLGRRGSGAAER